MPGDQAAALAPPRFFRAASAGAATTAAAATATATATAAIASGEAADAEPTLFEEFQRRKSAFLARFDRAEDALGSSRGAMAAGGPPSGSAATENPADWKCNVCNAPLRLLRLRVRLAAARVRHL